jgi:hypothetical protein
MGKRFTKLKPVKVEKKYVVVTDVGRRDKDRIKWFDTWYGKKFDTKKEALKEKKKREKKPYLIDRFLASPLGYGDHIRYRIEPIKEIQYEKLKKVI